MRWLQSKVRAPLPDHDARIYGDPARCFVRLRDPANRHGVRVEPGAHPTLVHQDGDRHVGRDGELLAYYVRFDHRGLFVVPQLEEHSDGREQWDAIVLKLPLFGKLNRIVAVSRFTRTLSTLLNGGVPMLGAMTIVRNVVDNEVIAKAIDIGRENISEGESIAGPLKKSGQFPPIVIHMINIGEKTGDLENMLLQVSDAYDFQVKVAIEGLTSLLEPLMIIVMGCVIGIIVSRSWFPCFSCPVWAANLKYESS